MSKRLQQLQGLRQSLDELLSRHRRTRMWFWRTGTAALASAGLWILMYYYAARNSPPSGPALERMLAVFVGALLMWILFLWSFWLMRKLNKLSAEAQAMQQRIAEVVSEQSGVSELRAKDS